MSSKMSMDSSAYNKVNMPVSSKLHVALGKPLVYRCQDVRQILTESSSKDIHSILPQLMESIFGFHNQPGWALNKSEKPATQEYKAVKELLSPQGPLLKVINQLTTDPYFQYEFPLTSLPGATQRLLDSGGVPNFYIDKLQLNQGGKPFNSVLLNAFEYFFFHFAYYVVNPLVAKSVPFEKPADSMYPRLLEEYLNYYLPLDGRGLPQYTQTSSTKPGLAQHTTSRATSSIHSTPGRSNLSSSFNRSPFENLRQKVPAPDTTEQTETWRTQTFLQILVDFLLNQSTSGAEVTRYSLQDVTIDNVLPSSDHVRVVRMLVKHMHYFTNSALPESIPQSPYSVPYFNHWDEFKRSAMQQFVQRKLYSFLRYTFQHWPLDSTFRLVLETWLSYLQPWRYVDPSQSNRELEVESTVKMVDDKWRIFIIENFLFFSLLFQNVLKRMLRMDLSSSKNAYILFRVSKVYTLANLRELVDDTERMLEMSCGVGRMGDMGSPYLSSMQQQHSNIGSIIVQHICEMEGSSFQYHSLFSESTFDTVKQLLTTINQAKQSVQAAGFRNGDTGNGSFFSFLGLGSSVDYNASSFGGYYYGDEIGAGENKKAEHHLDAACTNLCHFFQLETFDKPEKSVTWSSSNGRGKKGEALTPDVYEADDGHKLTPLGRYQLMNGLRKFDISYQGNPDLQPIRSFEIPILVRMCHGISSYINDILGKDIQSLCNKPGIIGRVAHHFFSPPRMPGSAPSSPDSRKQTDVYSKPRLSLRWVATYQNIGYLLTMYVFLYMWLGVGFVGFLVIMGFVMLFYALLRATVSPCKSKES